MHNLALELYALGHHVTGSDDEIFDPAYQRLQSAGLLPETFGWFPQKINTTLDGIILGMHARIDNPELLKAQEMGIPVYSFPAFIYEHSQHKKRVVLAGSHGKTTSTAMLMHILKSQNLAFDYMVGSLIKGYERMVQLSDAPLIILEGDEYLSSPIDLRSKFLHYKPHIAMITGIAWDHVNVFPTLDSYEGSFQTFLTHVSGPVIYYAGDSKLAAWCANRSGSISYQAPPHQKEGAGTKLNGSDLPEIKLPFFGLHNMENAAGVVEIAVQLGISRVDAWTALQDFPGTAKRLECIKEDETELIFRDFAHAPSKVKATVLAVREQFKEANLLAVLELHTYSSLQPEFMSTYKGLLDAAQEAWVLYDPHVFEWKKMPVPEKEEIQNRLGAVRLFNNPEELSNALQQWRSQSSPELKVSLWMSSGNFGGLKIV